MIIKLIKKAEERMRLKGLACSKSICCHSCSIKKTQMKRMYCLTLCRIATKINNLIDKI